MVGMASSLLPGCAAAQRRAENSLTEVDVKQLGELLRSSSHVEFTDTYCLYRMTQELQKWAFSLGPLDSVTSSLDATEIV